MILPEMPQTFFSVICPTNVDFAYILGETEICLTPLSIFDVWPSNDLGSTLFSQRRRRRTNSQIQTWSLSHCTQDQIRCKEALQQSDIPNRLVWLDATQSLVWHMWQVVRMTSWSHPQTTNHRHACTISETAKVETTPIVGRGRAEKSVLEYFNFKLTRIWW